MNRSLRLAFVIALTIAAMATLPSAARADRTDPLRSGTITGWAYTWPAMLSGEAKDCRWSEGIGTGNPECVAWLESDCSPTLSGRNPAVTASIVNVADLADGSSERVFEWSAGGPTTSDRGARSGGVVVQMWTEDCTEVDDGKWRSALWADNGRYRFRTNHLQTTLRIPPAVKWMTVTTNDTHKLEWRLT